MSDNNSGWPTNPAIPAKQDGGLAPLAPLAEGTQAAERDGQGRFVTGNNGGGRKKGSRNRLTETFLAAVETDFAEHGPGALESVRTNDPATYLRIIASLVPRDLILKREQERDFSDLPLSDVIDFIDRVRKNASIERQINNAKYGG